MKKVVRSILLLVAITAQAAVDKDTLHQYVWANYQQYKDNMPQAKVAYEQLLQKEGSPYAYKGYLHLLHENGLWKPIIQLMPRLDSYFADDLEMQMIFAQAMERTGDHTGCDERLIKINDKHKNNQDVAFATVQCYLRRKEPENALRVIDGFLNNVPSRPNHFVFYFIKSQIYVQMNKKQDALQSIQKSIELYPKFDKSWLMFAMLQEQAGRIDQAIQGYSHFLQETEDRSDIIEKHLTELALKHQKNLKTVSKERTLSPFECAVVCAQKKEHGKALEAVECCLKDSPSDVQYRLFKLDMLAALKKHDDLLSSVKSWILATPSHDFWYRTLHLAARQELTSQGAIEVLKYVASQHPTNILPVLYLADLYIRAKKDNAALAYLRKAARMSKDANVKAKVLYQIALIHYDKRQFQLAKRVLLHAQQLQSNFLPPLNLLAYYYASKEYDTDKALTLIDFVLTRENNNPHYLDTKAFILYKKGDYTGAIALLEKIVDHAPKDVTILRHLAKALNKQGERERAYAAINQAIQSAVPVKEKQKLQKIAQQWNKN